MTSIAAGRFFRMCVSSPLTSLPRALPPLTTSRLLSRYFSSTKPSLSQSPSHVDEYTSSDHNTRQHSERRIVPFSPEQLYTVVSDVNQYSQFVPWCTSSQVTRRVDDNLLIADLSVGFKFLSEKYTSVITVQPNRSVSADVPHSSLFDYLITDWTFDPVAHHRHKTALKFYVEFRFRNPLYRRVTDLFFEEVVKQMVTAFERQCYLRYHHQPEDGDECYHSKDHHGDVNQLTNSTSMHRW